MAVYKPDDALLRVQVESIRSQTLAEWTCLIGIDGVDELVARALAEAIGDDDRFVVIEYPENVGHYRNFERIIQRAVIQDVDWIALADQDDQWSATRLERLVSALGHGDTGGACCQASLVRRDGEIIGTTSRGQSGDLFGLLMDNRVTGTLSVFTRQVARLALPFPPIRDSAFHDHWLGVVAQATGSFTYLDDVLQTYVQHDRNAVGELNSGLRARLTRLRSSTASRSMSWLSYLSWHRWGWRAEMARVLIERELAGNQHQMLGSVASGKPRSRLTGLLLRSWGRGD
ncbi:glycosyltransferase, partial [Microbacterium schleiferi]|uniref:glycosyltransferase n=1 Tax=Microbacterium schleiferi TaxID=69362 RepID=UPI0035C7BB49